VGEKKFAKTLLRDSHVYRLHFKFEGEAKRLEGYIWKVSRIERMEICFWHESTPRWEHGPKRTSKSAGSGLPKDSLWADIQELRGGST